MRTLVSLQFIALQQQQKYRNVDNVNNIHSLENSLVCEYAQNSFPFLLSCISSVSIYSNVLFIILYYVFLLQHNDIGLLILDQPVPTTTLKVATVKLSTDPVISSGAVTIAGWGQMGWNLPSSPMLMETTIDIWSNRKCAALYGGLAPGGITNDMLCGSAAGKDACRGDSGEF